MASARTISVLLVADDLSEREALLSMLNEASNLTPDTITPFVSTLFDSATFPRTSTGNTPDVVVLYNASGDDQHLSRFDTLRASFPVSAIIVIVDEARNGVTAELLRQGAADVFLRSQMSGVALMRAVELAAEQRRVEYLERGITNVFAMLAEHAPLSQILEAINSTIEGQFPGMRSSILLYDEEHRCLRHGSAPSLSHDYNRIVDGLPIGPNTGSCGTAAYLRERVIVEDILSDPLWERYRQLGTLYNIRACWSQPILSSERRLLGTFALYYHEPRRPSPAELSLIMAASHLTCVVLERLQDTGESKQDIQRSEPESSVVGLLAGGIAHDFNNLLTSIIGSISLARIELAKKIGVERRFAEIERAAAQAHSLVHELLQIAMGGIAKHQVISLSEIVPAAVAVAVQDRTTQFDMRIDPDLWNISGDSTQLRQVFYNITLNACEAMSDGGRITVEISNAVVSDAETCEENVIPPGRYIRASFTDTGCGIAPDHLTRIFSPLFSTKLTGAGLGLALVSTIIRSHHGYIRVESASQRESSPDDNVKRSGTVFEVYLPALPPTTQQSAVVHIAHTRRRVLIMDDDDMVRETAGTMLDYLGYDVGFAVEGSEALSLYEEEKRKGQPFDVVILDLSVRGGLGGKATIRKLRQLDPAVRAIVISGYSDDPIMTNYQSHGFVGVVTKPFEIAALERMVTQAISPERVAAG